MDDDATRWDERYRDGAPPEPSPPEALADRVELVPERGRALDVACGAGAQSVWLAQRGLEVIGLDVSPVAIELTRRAATAVGVTVDTRVVDLDDGLPSGLGTFDVIVCQRFRQPAIYASIVEQLAPNGVAAITVLSEVGLDGPAGPFHALPGELLTEFDRPDRRAVDVIHHAEGDGIATIVLRHRT